MMKFNFINY